MCRDSDGILEGDYAWRTSPATVYTRLATSDYRETAALIAAAEVLEPKL